MNDTISRLFEVARDAAGACLVVAAESMEEVAHIVRGIADPPGWCASCQTVHASTPEPSSLPPGLAEVFAQARSARSSLAETATWVPAFASEVREGSLLLLDGPRGAQAMRVLRRKSTERQHMFGAPVESLTFLLVDADAGTPGSITVGPDDAMTVAFEVPGEVPADLAGGAA